MRTHPSTMINARGEHITVNTYAEALRVMSSFHGPSLAHRADLSGDLATARQALPAAKALRQRFEENLKIYSIYAEFEDIDSLRTALAEIAVQTKGLSDVAD